MSEAIIAVVITGIVTVITTVISSVVTSAKNKALIELKIEHQNEKIDALTERVDTHNNYASLIPAIQTDIANIKENMKR